MGKMDGKKFGALTVLSTRWERNASGNPVGFVLVRCDCGEEYETHYNNVVGSKGNRMCAACRKQEHKRNSAGFTKHPLFPTWFSMNDRCYNTTNDRYAGYGGRGIFVCQEWRRGEGDDRAAFAAFVASVGPRPEGMSLDRRDNSGPYSPSNCRWATREEQANNTRNNVVGNLAGERFTASQLARKLGVPVGKVLGPMSKYGLTLETVWSKLSEEPKARARWVKRKSRAAVSRRETETKQEQEAFDSYWREALKQT